MNVTGATGEKLKMGIDKVKSITIRNIEFQDTYALNQDLVGLKELIPDFGGLLRTVDHTKDKLAH